MKAKQLLLLILIFLVAVGIFAAKNVFIIQEVEIEEYSSLEIDFDDLLVNEIKIKGPNQDTETVNLEKRNDKWVIASLWNLKASNDKVEKLLSELSSLTGELRSTSKKVLSDYAITEDGAYSITLNVNDQSVKFFIGAKKPSYYSSFLRRDGSDRVYLVDIGIFSLAGIGGDIEGGVAPDQDFWVDLKLLEIDIDRVESIYIVKSIEGRDVDTILVKKEFDEEKSLMHWVNVGDSNALDRSKIKNYLAQLNNIRAKNAVEPGTGYGFDDPFLKILLKDDVNEKQIVIGNEVSAESKDRYIETPEGNAYIISESRLKTLDIDIDKFAVETKEEE